MSSLPRVAQPSIWQSIIPKFLRNPNNPPSPEKIRRTKEWNPAIFFIVMFLLIGSNAMHMIALRNEYTAFSRRADAKIGLLKDVIERVQRGEDVDVKGLLGTGNPEKERAWEEVIKELEEEDRLWQANARRRQKAEKSSSSQDHDETKEAGNPESSDRQEAEKATTAGKGDAPLLSRKAPRGFY
ncbi:MAG: hypothetical protein LQ352_000469 [Teloschistes flavicans]|nr:MAG: hypothetical protein LQ352_000469 [Teloschistes flavicans]